MKLRYITIRRSNGEVRQNYYFFENLKNNIEVELKSNEGILQWFDLEELYDLEMPFSAKYMIRHYIENGKRTEWQQHKLVGKQEHCHVEKEFKGKQRADKQ